mmetsp:Transcript_14066/g.46492  ORF Transcript_14066/g.46492 Transcript_14066/m.46492 type:complete len:463 (-) Transcript_14066:22-1410(-)
MDGCPVALLHLVKLVDAADAHIGQHERAALEDQIARHGVAHDGGGEADAGGALARRVDGARRRVRDVLEQLRLCDARVAHQADVDVAADPHAVRHLPRRAADHEEQERLLDVVVAEDLGRDRLGELGVDLGLLGELVELLLHLRGRREVDGGLLVLLDAHGLEEGVGDEARLELAEAGGGDGEEDARDGERVPRRALARHVPVQVDRHRARHVALRHLVGLLLDLDLLELFELGAARLEVERHAVPVGLRHEGGAVDELVHLGAVLLARVRRHLHLRLHLRHARHDALERQQRADVLRLDLPQRHRLVLDARQDEDLVPPRQLGRDLVVGVHASHRVARSRRRRPGTLLHQDVKDVAVGGGGGRRGKHIVDGARDDLLVAQRVAADLLRHLLAHVLRHIVELDVDAPRLTVGDLLQHLHVLPQRVSHLILLGVVLQEGAKLLAVLVVRVVPSRSRVCLHMCL